MTRLIRTAVLVGILFAWCADAFALNPALDVNQYAHTAWRIRDGFLKGNLQAIAQTPDGYLWLGTDAGLFRFDGVRVTSWQPPGAQELPSVDVLGLLAARDGSLWIGTTRGLARWDGRALARYAALNEQYVAKLLEDREGTVWATAFANSTTWTLCSIQKGVTACHGSDGGPGVGALGLFEDSDGTLWVGTLAGLWRWKPGPPRFFPLPRGPNGIQALADAAGDALLVGLTGGIHTFTEGRTEMALQLPASVRPPEARQLLRDRDGSLWIATVSSGLLHVHQGITDAFAQSDGLSADHVGKLFEDHEGSIWVVTGDGLDRFRDPTVATLSARQGLSNSVVVSVAAAKSGGAWLGTFDGLSRVENGRGRRVDVSPMPGGDIQSILPDRLGRVWISSRSGVGYLENDRFVSVRGLPGGFTRAIVEDSRDVWVANQERGLFRVSPDAQHIERFPWAALGHEDPATAVTADAKQSGVWLGFARGGVAQFSDGRIVQSRAPTDGLPGGIVRDLRLEPDGTLWVATAGGLSRLKGGRLATLTSQNGLPCDDVRWLVEDHDRSLWVATICGLINIARAELDRWGAAADAGQPSARMALSSAFDMTDGVRIYGLATYSAPAVMTTDGRLWFRSTDGLSVLDTRHLPINSLPPPVHIEQITADRTAYMGTGGDDGPLRLPALTHDLQIDYTALSFVAPEKVRFRYKLEGYDSEWRDVGTRRQAFYNGLRPGNYRFLVTASNNSGVWNQAGASVEFSVAPAYYQTPWFVALSLAAVVALVWTGHRVRLRIVERHQSEIIALNERLMKAQEQERIRIAGELHDGVAQEMLAVTMMLGTARRRLPEESDAKAALDKIQQKMIRMGTDIRQISHDLHPPVLQEAGLPEAVRTYCEEFAATSGIPVRCEADDKVSDLSRGAGLALFRILQEALGNAAKHAAPKQITVRLTRFRKMVFLTVSDDGAGFARSQLANGGGLGLVSMRERANQLNGLFEVDSEPGRGTKVRVEIPFR